MAAVEDMRPFDPLKDKSYQSTRLGRDVADFLAWMSLGGASPRTLDQYERDLARGALMFPNKGLGELEDGDAIHIARQFRPAERRVRIAAWRSFYKWAKRSRRVTVDPFDVLPTLRRPAQKVYDIFTDAETAALVGMPSPDGALMAVLFDTGARKADCRHLQVKDFRTANAPGEFSFLAGKGGKDRLVPATLRAAHAVNDLILLEGLNARDHLWYSVRANDVSRKLVRRDPIGDGTFARWWTRCLEDAGVRYRNPHMTRHTFATSWLRRGGRLETLSVVMGHASIRTTFDLYGHLDMSDVLIDMRQIESGA